MPEPFFPFDGDKGACEKCLAGRQLPTYPSFWLLKFHIESAFYGVPAGLRCGSARGAEPPVLCAGRYSKAGSRRVGDEAVVVRKLRRHDEERWVVAWHPPAMQDYGWRGWFSCSLRVAVRELRALV